MTKVVATGTLLCGLVFGAGYWTGRPGSTSGQIVWSMGPTITHLESLGELVATRVHISDVLVANDEGYRGSWLIKGDALLTIDLGQAKIITADPSAQTATIRLPQPRALSPRINHERSKTWSIEKTAWLPWKGDSDAMRDKAMAHAQKLVEHAANSEDNLAPARASAERIIAKVYRMVEWDVTIEWEAAPNHS